MVVNNAPATQRVMVELHSPVIPGMKKVVRNVLKVPQLSSAPRIITHIRIMFRDRAPHVAKTRQHAATMVLHARLDTQNSMRASILAIFVVQIMQPVPQALWILHAMQIITNPALHARPVPPTHHAPRALLILYVMHIITNQGLNARRVPTTQNHVSVVPTILHVATGIKKMTRERRVNVKRTTTAMALS